MRRGIALLRREAQPARSLPRIFVDAERAIEIDPAELLNSARDSLSETDAARLLAADLTNMTEADLTNLTEADLVALTKADAAELAEANAAKDFDKHTVAVTSRLRRRASRRR